MKIIRTLVSLCLCITLCNSAAYANLKVGTALFYPPFSMSVGTGFDAVMISVICYRLHEKCELIPMDYYQLFPALDDGQIDIATAGITIPKYQKDHFIYSVPYLLSKGTFLVLNSSSAQSINDLRGKKVGIMKEGLVSGPFYIYLQRTYPKQFQIITYAEMEDLVDALKKGEISAAFTHESTMVYWRLNGHGQFKSLGRAVEVGNGIGIMTIPKNKALIQNINQQIIQLEKEKFYLDIYSTYFSSSY